MNVAALYRYLWSLRDPRTESWGLTADAKFIFPLLALYLYVTKIAGPRFMKDCKPFELKPYIIAYNLSMVIINAYFFWSYWRRSYGGGHYNVFCQGISYSRDKNSMEILKLTWWYVFVRIADFIDTMFFLLRKKFSHISGLHVTHHTLVVFSGWLWLTFGCDGQVLMGICFNSFIHVIMYSYYVLSALGPGIQKYLWWKKYLTKLQIFQFIFLTLHVSIPLVYDCGYPRILTILAAVQGLLGLGLFIDFYIKRYSVNPDSLFCTLQTTAFETPNIQTIDAKSQKNA